MSSTNIAADFGSASTTLAESMERAMASLYSLQTSLISTQGCDSQALRSTFVDVRKPLKASWESILALLQKSHAFGSDVVLLKESLRTESVEDCMEFLMEMSITADDLLGLSKARLTESEDAIIRFLIQMPAMVEVLQASVKRSGLMQGSQENLNMPGHLQSNTSHRKIWVEPTTANAKTVAFVEANLAIVHPDGFKAIHATRDALIQINSDLGTIHRFWQLTSGKCQETISESLKVTPNITVGQATQFAEAWKGYQEALQEALTSVARSCDAILVDAVGAPPPRARTPTYSSRGYFSRQPQHRQGAISACENPYPTPPRPNTGEKSGWMDWFAGLAGGDGDDHGSSRMRFRGKYRDKQ